MSSLFELSFVALLLELTLRHLLRVVRWLLPQLLISLARCAWVCSPALSGRGSPATASLVLRLFTYHACDSVDRAFDSCGNRAWISHVAIPLVVLCEDQREAAIVYRAALCVFAP